jgi:natural product biosynthesis luciferase-like monooxygenase protein
MFWGDGNICENASEYYRLLLEIARYGDENQYTGIWLPERHFHPWGAFHPNPSVLGAAVAVATKNIKIRAGSVVLPLHSPFRVAEEWSLVDNLSNGRVELAFATGWKDDDFVIAPESYKTRKHDQWELIENVIRLWQGGSLVRQNGSGVDINVATYPRPLQQELPTWITSAGSLRTVSDAGHGGYNLLTHLIGQDYDSLAKKIAQYRAYRVRAGIGNTGKIALMLHTFVGTDKQEVKNFVKDAMSAYLLHSADLSMPNIDLSERNALHQVMKDEMIEIAFNRYFENASLMGSVDTCKTTLKRLAEMGITEVCCLVDFGLPLEAVRDHMKYLTELKNWCAASKI